MRYCSKTNGSVGSDDALNSQLGKSIAKHVMLDVHQETKVMQEISSND